MSELDPTCERCHASGLPSEGRVIGKNPYGSYAKPIYDKVKKEYHYHTGEVQCRFECPQGHVYLKTSRSDCSCEKSDIMEEPEDNSLGIN